MSITRTSLTRTSRLAVGAVLLALTATTLTIAAPPGQAWTARDRAEAPASRARIPSPADHLKGPGPAGGPSDRDPSDPPEGCDFDADGLPDLAIGVPGEDDGGGGVNLQYSDPFDFQTPDRLRPEDMGYWGDEPTRFGTALACGDFDADGDDDLAVGAPGTTSTGSLGRVSVVDGSPTGLQFVGDFPKLSTFTSSDLFPGIGLGGDQFGQTLEVGDFDGDGTDDLAVGAPNDTAGGPADERGGSVQIVHGLAGIGFTVGTVRPQFLTGTYTSEPGEIDGAGFGLSLAAAPMVDGQGDDLAVGAPWTDVENHDHPHPCGSRWECGEGTSNHQDRAGAVYLFRSDDDQLELHHRWIQSDLFGPPLGSENGEWFGYALAAGNVDGSDDIDLTIGTPYERSFTEETGAGIIVSLGGTGDGPTAADKEIRSQSSTGLPEETGDGFGWSLAAANLDGDGYDDLAVGAPGEDVDEVLDGGSVSVFYGSAGGPGNGVSYTEANFTVAGSDEVDYPWAYDYLGASVAFTRTALGPALVIGIPGRFMESSGKYGVDDRAGQVEIVPQWSGSLLDDSAYRMHQDVEDPFDVVGARELSPTMAPAPSLAWYGEDLDGTDPVIPTGEWFGWSIAS